jgi:hypothetical protein
MTLFCRESGLASEISQMVGRPHPAVGREVRLEPKDWGSGWVQERHAACSVTVPFDLRILGVTPRSPAALPGACLLLLTVCVQEPSEVLMSSGPAFLCLRQVPAE